MPGACAQPALVTQICITSRNVPPPRPSALGEETGRGHWIDKPAFVRTVPGTDTTDAGHYPDRPLTLATTCHMCGADN